MNSVHDRSVILVIVGCSAYWRYETFYFLPCLSRLAKKTLTTNRNCCTMIVQICTRTEQDVKRK